MASLAGAFFAAIVLCSVLVQAAAAKPLVPAMFVFGDSLVDVGNNNYLARCNESCKANHRPYGVDHTCHLPTGRFSNGFNLADQIARLLRFNESPPAFLSLSLESASASPGAAPGINFASGGSGLLPTTGSTPCGEVVPMVEQVGNFTGLVRGGDGESQERRAPSFISESLFFISAGSNDLFEYSAFVADPRNRHAGRNDTVFLQGLIDAYRSYLKVLYAAGARKFSVVSPSLVGCSPSQRALAQNFTDVDGYGCFGTANKLSGKLHPMIAAMLRKLSRELPGMKYSLGNTIKMARFIFEKSGKPDSKFKTIDQACCGSGDFRSGLCNRSAHVCRNRSSFFFWDRFHPTETASAFTANQLFVDSGKFVRPINVRQLATSRP